MNSTFQVVYMAGCTSHVGHVVKHCVLLMVMTLNCNTALMNVLVLWKVLYAHLQEATENPTTILCMASLNTTIYLGEYNSEGKQVASYTTLQAHNY